MPPERSQWVLLAFRLAREPSTPRIAVWRKLQRLGTARLLDGLVALPLDNRNQEQLEWIAQDIAEAGGSLSGGERQRLSVARAIIKDAPILILDEPTSSLDAISEEIVFAALRRLRAGPLPRHCHGHGSCRRHRAARSRRPRPTPRSWQRARRRRPSGRRRRRRIARSAWSG